MVSHRGCWSCPGSRAEGRSDHKAAPTEASHLCKPGLLLWFGALSQITAQGKGWAPLPAGHRTSIFKGLALVFHMRPQYREIPISILQGKRALAYRLQGRPLPIFTKSPIWAPNQGVHSIYFSKEKDLIQISNMESNTVIFVRLHGETENESDLGNKLKAIISQTVISLRTSSAVGGLSRSHGLVRPLFFSDSFLWSLRSAPPTEPAGCVQARKRRACLQCQLSSFLRLSLESNLPSSSLLNWESILNED